MDLGWVRGYGVFDYLITYRDRKPFHLTDHLARLKNSTSLIGLNLPWSDEELGDIVQETLDQNTKDKEKAIRIVVTGGVSEDSITPSDTPTLAVFVDNIKPYPGEFYENGVGAITADHTRFLPGAKSLNYLFAVRALQEARQRNAVEAIYVDNKSDTVFEGTTSNVFVVRDGQIITPKSDILPGITRQVLLTKCNLDQSVHQQHLGIGDLRQADEVFLTASNKEIMPITTLDGYPISNGKVGSVTKSVMKRFREYTLEEDW